MADDLNENGTTNGDVPEIELIIKVGFFSSFQFDFMSATRGVPWRLDIQNYHCSHFQYMQRCFKCLYQLKCLKLNFIITLIRSVNRTCWEIAKFSVEKFDLAKRQCSMAHFLKCATENTCNVSTEIIFIGLFNYFHHFYPLSL